MTGGIERTVEVAGEEKTVKIAIKECDNCGDDVEVPSDQADSDRFSFCSIRCNKRYVETETQHSEGDR